MKNINLKRYNDITYPSRITDNVKLVEHNQENIALQFEALKTNTSGWADVTYTVSR